MIIRGIAVCLAILSLASDLGIAPAEAQGLFSRSRTQRRAFRAELIDRGRETDQKEAESQAPSPFDGVEAPPAAPRAQLDQVQQRQPRLSLNGQPSTTIQMVDEALERTKRRYLTAGEHTPWQILHGVLALRHEFQLRNGNELVRGLDWLRDGVVHDGLPLIQKTDYGARCHPYTQPWAFEGHTNQFLAILSIAGLPDEYQFRTPAGEIVTMDDMVRHAQASIDGRGEMTWTLWFLTHYVAQDAEWETAAGQYWSMERLVRMEARQKINGAPCGGTHRLFALSLARNAYLAEHGQARGAWLEADQKVQQFVATVKSLQNRDGSFSSDWFKGRGYSTDLTTRLKTSGHTLEWLMVALPESQIRDRWVQLAVQSVARDVIRSATEPAECGALYHALDALTFYKLRQGTPAPDVELSPTYLIPPSNPSQPSTEIVDVPVEELDPNTPGMFEAPLVAQPLNGNPAPKRVAALPEPTLRPLAGAGDEIGGGSGTQSGMVANKSQSSESSSSDPNSLVVEEIDLSDMAPATSKPLTTTPADLVPSVTGPDVDVSEVAVVDPTPESTTPSSETPADEPLEPQLVVEAVQPSDLARDLLDEPIPLGLEPLQTILPSEPDGESSPHVVESELPSANIPADAPETETPETDVVAVETAEVASDGGDEPAEMESTIATAEEPSAAPVDGVAQKEVPVASSKGENEPLQKLEELDDAPKLTAPPRPEVEEPKPRAKSETVAEEPADAKTSMRAPLRRGSLIVIQLDDIEHRPIIVPMVGQPEVQRVRFESRPRARW